MLAQNASRFIVKRRQKGRSMEALAKILGRKKDGRKKGGIKTDRETKDRK